MSSGRIKAKERVARGLCPQCGKEAAPYYLCFDCRHRRRINRCLKKGARTGALEVTGTPFGHKLKDALWFADKPARSEEAEREWLKHGTPLVPDPETDKRFQPRIHRIRVDVEAILVNIIQHVGRPVTVEEIHEVWGGLRDRRVNPLPNDIARLIVAKDKRAKKAARRLRIHSNECLEARP